MKRKTLFAFIIICMMPIHFLFGQSYGDLWKQADDAHEKDLPQTELKVLQGIARKAAKERAYGQLLKAELSVARTQAMLSSDSLLPAVKRLELQEQQATDVCLRAVYNAVIGRIYADNRSALEDGQRLSVSHYEKAMSQPALLAQAKDNDYKPFANIGNDSRYFGHDLLSLIAYETGHFETAHRYYLTTENRQAQLFTALEMLRKQQGQPGYADRLDSLINSYADLTETGEAAIERYEAMETQNATAAERVAYIDKALLQWGKWKRMGALRNARQMLTLPQFHANIESELFIPQRQQTIELNNLRGLQELTVNFYQAKIGADSPLCKNIGSNWKKLQEVLTPLPELTRTLHFAKHEEYELFEDSLQLPPLPVGIYVVEMKTSPATATARQLYYVSNVRVMRLPLPDGKLRLLTVNATTGQPITGTQLRIAHRKYNSPSEELTVRTDAQGEFIYVTGNNHERCEIFAFTDHDTACPPLDTWSNTYQQPRQDTRQECVVYTDRAIYQPGQTVHVGAIAYQVAEGYKHQALASKELTMTLRDANYQEVATKIVKTDSLGTCTADFVLPLQGLTGQYSVSVGNAANYFQVEEYVRPTFQVEFEKVTSDYQKDDTVTVRAKARTYAGMAVAGAHVRYKVVRRRAFWWMSWSRYWQGGSIGTASNEEILTEGEASTSDDGSFSVNMPMVLPETPYAMFYNFVATADVTDLAGETRQAQLSLPLGNRKTALTTTLPQQVQREKLPQVKFNLRNAAGNDIEAIVRYQIDGGSWKQMKTNTPDDILPTQLKSGRHLLKAICQQDTLEEAFVVFSQDDKRPATQTDDWFWASAPQFPNDGTPVTVQVGSSDSNVHIAYAIADDKGHLIESGATDKTNELINRKFCYSEKYGNGLSMTFAWVKEGKIYEHTLQLQRPLPDRRLKLRWETFRDRLSPGQQEVWTLSVALPDGRPAPAQLMATLYDKSLDQIKQHDWLFTPYIFLPIPDLRWQQFFRYALNLSGVATYKYIKVENMDFSQFDHELYPTPWNVGMRMRVMRSARAKGVLTMAPAESNMALDAAPMAATESMMDATAEMKTDRLAKESGDEEQEQPQGETPALRTNLQETAFFYPQLSADHDGMVKLKFTLPESLTTWRLLGLAHTADMMYGTIDGEAVAQKEVMVQPNMPRFLRQGDRSILAARIANTTDKTLTGTVRLQLVDPETDSTLFDQQQEVSIEAGSTTSTTFDVQPEALNGPSDLLVCRWSVSADGHADGEQHYLPILPDRERVTLAIPFTQNGPGTKEIDLTALPADSAQLTIEYANNPAWFMVQALPTIAETSNDNAVSQATALYANLLGRHLIGQLPEARTVIEQWKNEKGNETSLQSNLARNLELKELLLSETPWVLDAQREEEQKLMLSNFFDNNLMQMRIDLATEKLKKLQNDNGSWSWWQGMQGSSYMTIAISQMLVRLNMMAGKQKETTDMLNSAFKFAGNKMVSLVNEMKRQEKKGVKPHFPSQMALEWLYTCAIDGRSLPSSVEAANSYLKRLLKKEVKNQTIYEKALTAIVLSDKTYAKSLKQWTVYSEEAGRYYDTQRAGYSWRDYRIPTQVAAIEALQRLTPSDRQTIDEMQRWLLQEKRTQAWDTPVNSVDAIYAFFCGRQQEPKSPLDASHAPLTRLKIDGQPIETPKATAGIGYVKTTLPVHGAKTFAAEKTSQGTSWGAVYAQFMQQATDISSHANGIRVKRELMVAGNSAPTTLRPGDRVKVRITIDADRDYDFVQVTDKRAACMEPVEQLSGYRYGYYYTPKNCSTNYYFDMLSKGKHIIETEYYVSRAGQYATGTCTAQCAYAPEFGGHTKSETIIVTPEE